MKDATPDELKSLVEGAVQEEKEAYARYVAAQSLTLGALWMYLDSLGIYPGTLCDVTFSTGVEECIFEGCAPQSWISGDASIRIAIRHFTSKRKPAAQVSWYERTIVYHMKRSLKAERGFPRRS